MATRTKSQRRRRAARRARSRTEVTVVEPEPLTPVAVDTEPDHSLFVAGAIRAAGFLLAGQALGSIVGALFDGRAVVIRLRFGILPSLGVATPTRAAAASISTWATIGAVAAVAAGVLLALARRRDQPLLLQGWGAGIPMAGLLVALQLSRHLADPPHVELWRLSQAAAVVGAVGLLYIGFAPPHIGPLRRAEPTSLEEAT